jgi:hypothetical protein
MHGEIRGSTSSYILDDHDQEGQLNAQGLVSISGASNIVSGHIGTHDLQDRGLDVRVRYSLNVTVPHTLVPNLQRFGPKGRGLDGRNMRGLMDEPREA